MRTRSHTRGIMLVRMLAYMAGLTIIANVAAVLYWRCTRNSIGLTRNTNDILRTLKAGERWREDIRRAPRVQRSLLADPGEPDLDYPEPIHDGHILTIKQDAEVVRYRFAKGAVWRKGRGDRDWVLVLAKVQSSKMLKDTRNGVASWRWELELASSSKPRIRPLFTFRAVPLGKATSH